jgi:hypothetical protein
MLRNHLDATGSLECEVLDVSGGINDHSGPRLLNPFVLFGRILIAGFRITGYALSYGAHIVWVLMHKKPETVGDAIGEFGHAVTDAIADIFRA